MAASKRTLIGLVVIVVAVGAGQQWLARRSADRLGPTVASLAQVGDIRMISSQTCGYCIAARQWFERHRVAYAECTIETDASCLAEYQALGAPGTPVIRVRERAMLGFSPERLQQALQRPG